MIPLKIALKNFLSYGSDVQEIDLANYSLICFSGKNGNGKSALLDAITWVLWGQARKISGTIKPDEGLLRLGQTQMLVCMEFEFGGQLYRVRREFAKTYGKPYTALDFEIFDSSREKFIALTDKTIKLTQTKIEKLLGIDYETFTNSAFLRQGMADEFSKKSPKDRKQILTNILGFSKYDDLQSLALEKSRELSEEKKLSVNINQQNEAQIAREGEFVAQLSEKKAILENLNTEILKLEHILLDLEKKNLFLDQQKQQYEILSKDILDIKNKYFIKRDEFHKMVSEWKDIHYKSLHMPNITDLENTKNSLIQEEKKFLLLQQKVLLLQEDFLFKKGFYQNKINDFKIKKEKENYQLRVSIEKRELELKQLAVFWDQKNKLKCDIENKIALCESEFFKIKTELEKNINFEENFLLIKNQFDKRKAFYQALLEKGNWINSAQNELVEKCKIIQDQQSPCCPLCEQVLTVKRKQFLSTKFKKETSFLKHRFIKVSDLVKKLKEILLVQHEELKKISLQSDYLKQICIKKNDLEKNIENGKQELEVLKKSVLETEKKQKDYSQNLLKEKEFLEKFLKQSDLDIIQDPEIAKLAIEIALIEKQKNELNYDKKAHLLLQNKINEIDNKLIELDVYKKEFLKQKDRKKEIENFIKELKISKNQILQQDEKLKKFNFDENIFKNIDENIKKVKYDFQEVFKQKDGIFQSIGSIENDLKRIENLKNETIKTKERLSLLDNEAEEFQILAQSFGKNGIQALLLEEAIPQIEEEANNILARLTDNQSQVFIESLRDLKSGGVRETLDIQISDSAGIRPYEMFSGGEAFRVDFALRIAISKLLSKRAGTALQTLIIDEGFGSQDEEGLGRLMDAIYLISRDFAKIIIVSHLVSFKENFPVHFIIEKTSSGSIIKVEERG